MGNERFSFVRTEIVRLVRAGSGIEKSECRATEAEGGPASRKKRSLRQGPEMKGTQKQAALKSLKRAEYVHGYAYRRRVRFRVTKEDEKPSPTTRRSLPSRCRSRTYRGIFAPRRRWRRRPRSCSSATIGALFQGPGKKAKDRPDAPDSTAPRMAAPVGKRSSLP